MNLPKSSLTSREGFTLVEVITSVAILALLSLLVFTASSAWRMALKQAGNETMAASMAFAVLEAIRAEASELDLNNAGFNDLGLTNPRNFKVTVEAEPEGILPDLYLVTVRVEERNDNGILVTMRTLVRG